jgi:integrase
VRGEVSRHEGVKDYLRRLDEEHRAAIAAAGQRQAKIDAGELIDLDGEARGLRPESIRKETKNRHRHRRIDLPHVTLEALRKRLKLRLGENPKVEQVFTSAEGTLIRMSNLRRRWWRPLVERAAELAAKNGFLDFPTDLRIYDLRHTACALLSYSGVPLEVARERMGHSSIRLTADTYGHIFPSMQRDAASNLQKAFEEIRRNDAAAQK